MCLPGFYAGQTQTFCTHAVSEACLGKENFGTESKDIILIKKASLPLSIRCLGTQLREDECLQLLPYKNKMWQISCTHC